MSDLNLSPFQDHIAGEHYLCNMVHPESSYSVCNLTPHNIRIFGRNDTTLDIPPSGWVARLAEEDGEPGRIDWVPAPVVDRRLGGVELRHDDHPTEELGEPVTGPGGSLCYLIVSLPVAQALASREDILAPDTGAGAVRDQNGHIIGVRRFVRITRED